MERRAGKIAQGDGVPPRERVEGETRARHGEKVERRGAGRVARDARGVDGDESRREGR